MQNDDLYPFLHILLDLSFTLKLLILSQVPFTAMTKQQTKFKEL